MLASTFIRPVLFCSIWGHFKYKDIVQKSAGYVYLLIFMKTKTHNKYNELLNNGCTFIVLKPKKICNTQSDDYVCTVDIYC